MPGCAPLSDRGPVRIARALGAIFVAAFVIVSGAAGAEARKAKPAPAPAPAAAPAVDADIAQLDSLRQQCIAAARSLRERERAVGAIDLAVSMMRHGVEAKDREVAGSRKAQEALLAALERLARMPLEAMAFSPEGPVERLRSGILMAAAVPALTAQAHQLTGDLAALETVRKQIDASRKQIDDARAAVDKSRVALAELVTQRNALDARLVRDDGRQDTGKLDMGKLDMGKLAEASDVSDLIKRADAAMEQRDKELADRLRAAYGKRAKGAPPFADPTRPKTLRTLDAPNVRMVWPVSGDIAHHAGEKDKDGKPRLGITWTAMPKGTVVAPFDGRVVYVGPFRDYGLILIIDHGGGYHSLLELGQADVTAGQWLLAGEPVGSLADTAGTDSGASFYMELRRGGYPVDPEPRFAGGDQKTEETRVRQ